MVGNSGIRPAIRIKPNLKGHSFRSNKKDSAWCSCKTWSCIIVKGATKSSLRGLWESHIAEVLWQAGITRVPTV